MNPFEPFTAREEGALLVLRRRRTAALWAARLGLYGLLLCVLALGALIPFAAYTRGDGIGDVLLAALLLLPTWGVFKLVVLGFRLEGLRAVRAGPTGLAVDTRGVVFRRRAFVPKAQLAALRASIEKASTEHGSVRWLALTVVATSGDTELGYLQLPPEPDAARDRAGFAAAGQIAERLGIPLQVRGAEGGDEEGRPVWFEP